MKLFCGSTFLALIAVARADIVASIVAGIAVWVVFVHISEEGFKG